MDLLVLGAIVYFFGGAGTFAYLAFTSDKLRTARAVSASLLWPLFWAMARLHNHANAFDGKKILRSC